MTSSEYTEEEEEEDDEGAADFTGDCDLLMTAWLQPLDVCLHASAGGLKTTVVWDPASKQLGFKLRQSIENSRKVSVKWKGLLNATAGTHSYVGHVRKDFYTQSPVSLTRVIVAAEEARRGTRPSDPSIDPNRFLPAGFKTLFFKVGAQTNNNHPLRILFTFPTSSQDWILSPGLSFNSDPARRVRYAINLAKAPQFLTHSPMLDSWITGKASCQVDPKAGEVSSSIGAFRLRSWLWQSIVNALPFRGCWQVSTTASLRLKLLRYNVTSKQDLRVSLGVDVASAKSFVNWSKDLYLKISENNLSLKFQNAKWTLLYTL